MIVGDNFSGVMTSVLTLSKYIYSVEASDEP